MPVSINITGLENVNREALEEAMMEREAPELTEPSNHPRDQEAPAHHGNDTGAQEVGTRSETGPGGELTVEIEEEAFEEIPRPISPLPPRQRTTIPSRFEEYLDQNRRVDRSYIRTQQFQEDMHRQTAENRPVTSYDEEDYDHWDRNYPGIDIQNVTPRIFCTTGRRQMIIQANTTWGDLEEGFPPVRPRFILRDRHGFRREEETTRLLRQPEWYFVSNNMIRLWPEEQVPESINEIEELDYDIEVFVERETDCGEESMPWKVQIVHCVGRECFFCSMKIDGPFLVNQ